MGIGAGEGIIMLVIMLVPALLTLWGLVDVLRHEFVGSNKVIWVVVILILGPVGAVLYALIGRKHRILKETATAN